MTINVTELASEPSEDDVQQMMESMIRKVIERDIKADQALMAQLDLEIAKVELKGYDQSR